MTLFLRSFCVRKRRTAHGEPIRSALRNLPKQMKGDCNAEWLRSPNSYNEHPVCLPRMGHMAVRRCEERIGRLQLRQIRQDGGATPTILYPASVLFRLNVSN